MARANHKAFFFLFFPFFLLPFLDDILYICLLLMMFGVLLLI